MAANPVDAFPLVSARLRADIAAWYRDPYWHTARYSKLAYDKDGQPRVVAGMGKWMHGITSHGINIVKTTLPGEPDLTAEQRAQIEGYIRATWNVPWLELYGVSFGRVDLADMNSFSLATAMVRLRAGAEPPDSPENDFTEIHATLQDVWLNRITQNGRPYVGNVH